MKKLSSYLPDLPVYHLRGGECHRVCLEGRADLPAPHGNGMKFLLECWNDRYI